MKPSITIYSVIVVVFSFLLGISTELGAQMAPSNRLPHPRDSINRITIGREIPRVRDIRICGVCAPGFRRLSLNELSEGQRRNPAAQGASYGCVATEALENSMNCPDGWEKRLERDYSGFSCRYPLTEVGNDREEADEIGRSLFQLGVNTCRGFYTTQEADGGTSWVDNNPNRLGVSADVTCHINSDRVCGNSACHYGLSGDLELSPRERVYFCSLE